jgi:hypothetical protein
MDMDNRVFRSGTLFARILEGEEDDKCKIQVRKQSDVGQLAA